MSFCLLYREGGGLRGEFVTLPCHLYLRLTISVALLHSSVFKARVGKMSLNFVNSCTVTEECEG